MSIMLCIIVSSMLMLTYGFTISDNNCVGFHIRNLFMKRYAWAKGAAKTRWMRWQSSSSPLCLLAHHTASTLLLNVCFSIWERCLPLTYTTEESLALHEEIFYVAKYSVDIMVADEGSWLVCSRQKIASSLICWWRWWCGGWGGRWSPTTVVDH